MPPSSTEHPEPSLVRQLLSRYAEVRLDGSMHDLREGDREAVRRLVQAARWIDRIYWRQRSEEGWQLKQKLSKSRRGRPGEFERLLDLGFGPWDVFDNDRPFWGNIARPPGANLYPADLTRDELELYLESHDEERRPLLSQTTQVRRDGDRFVAVPYAELFKNELAHVASGLIDASRYVSHAGFGHFLIARANDLVAGTHKASDAQWIGVADSPIDIAIGPYEVYDDSLLGLKTSYEATLMVRHPMTDRLKEFETVAVDLGRRLPGAVAPSSDRQHVVIGVYDVVYVAGSTNMGAKPIAAMLPNDEQVRRKYGSRLLLFRNVITAKFTAIMKPLADRLLRPDQAALVQEDAFFWHTLLHEMAHALVADPDALAARATATPNERLRERYSTIEEGRADLVGLVFLDLLAERGRFPPALAAAGVVTFVAGNLRALRFGSDNDYSRAAAIILSHLQRRHALTVDLDGRLVIDIEGARTAAAALAERVQRIAATGDYEGAGSLIAQLGSLPPQIERAVRRLEDIPIDLEFHFDESLLG